MQTTTLVFALPLLMLINACSSMLPESHSNNTPFASFEEARAAIEKLEPRKSERQAMERDGFNPTKQPNINLLTHADVVRRFLPGAVLTRADLDPGILACVEARDGCRGMEIIGQKIDRVRTGSFFADFFNFQRRTQVTGWRFNAIVLFVNDIVVYRSWGGQPSVNEIELTRNPLGPLQDIGPASVTPR